MLDGFSQSFSFHKQHFLFQIQQHDDTPNEIKRSALLKEVITQPRAAHSTHRTSAFFNKSF